VSSAATHEHVGMSSSIDITRIARDIAAIAGFSEEPPATGYSRPTFSAAWAVARDYIIAEAAKTGCRHRIDAAGNVHLRPAGLAWETPAWLSGSHLDSVPTGGKYDGVVGVVVPLEVLRAHPQAPLELVLFAEEEGTTFNLGMLGSRIWAGGGATLTAADLAKLRNKHGQSPLEAGRPHGVDPSRFALDKLNAAHYRGFIEVHVEQGLAMWDQNMPVGVVTVINGRRQYACTITGKPNHAGSTEMGGRHDALAAFAEILWQLEQGALRLNAESAHTVLTVGQLFVRPNAINVIPGEVVFTIDFRAQTAKMLDVGNRMIAADIEGICHRRQLTFDLQRTEALPPVPMSSAVCRALRTAATSLGISLPDVASGALHDAAILAPLLATAMLFVASKDGISHNPAEFSRVEDIALAARILAATVTA